MSVSAVRGPTPSGVSCWLKVAGGGAASTAGGAGFAAASAATVAGALLPLPVVGAGLSLLHAAPAARDARAARPMIRTRGLMARTLTVKLAGCAVPAPAWPWGWA